MIYLLTDCTPSNGTVMAVGSPEDIWLAVEANGGIGADRIVRLNDTHDVGDRVSVDWSSEVHDLAAEC